MLAFHIFSTPATFSWYVDMLFFPKRRAASTDLTSVLFYMLYDNFRQLICVAARVDDYREAAGAFIPARVQAVLRESTDRCFHRR